MTVDTRRDLPIVLPRRPIRTLPIVIVLLLILVVAIAIHLNFASLFTKETAAKIADFAVRFVHPRWDVVPEGLRLMGVTLAIGFWGTALAFVLGIIAAPLAVRNISPMPAYFITRELLNFFRAMPDSVLTLILLGALDLGPLPAVIALGLHAGALLGKFFSENMERIEPGTYEALKASGAGFTHTMLYGAWPSVLREAVGYTLYIFDRNVRMASVLGLVGAGGIGGKLYTALRFFNYEQASAYILIIIVTVLLIDATSTFLRRKLV